MLTSEFLFPKNLRVTIKASWRILLIGDCEFAAILKEGNEGRTNIDFDHIVFANLAELPTYPPHDLLSYDFCVVQLPFRSIVGDELIRLHDLKAGAVDATIARAKEALRLSLDSALRYNKEASLLTIVSDFTEPQALIANSLRASYEGGDWRRVWTELNSELRRLVAPHTTVFIADSNAVAASCGKQGVVDDFISFHSRAGLWRPAETDYDTANHHNAPATPRSDELIPLGDTYTSRLLEYHDAMLANWEHIYRVHMGVDAVKLVIFDLDNTLWRGVLLEDYADGRGFPVPHGWPTGMWEAVHHLRARGILVAVCSRNDRSLVEERWARAISPGWLRLTDFDLVEIGWEAKSSAVERLIKRGGLTGAGVVFVDDNPIERAEVSAALPQIRTLGSNPYTIRRDLLWSAETQKATITSEAHLRADNARVQSARQDARRGLSREEFLESLDCSICLRTVRPDGGPDWLRTIELLQRTNQFNTTHKRWTEAELKKEVAEGTEVICWEARDRLTEYGLIGAALVRGSHIEQVVMSCRALGLEIEIAALSYIAENLKGTKQGEVTAGLIRRSENIACHDVFARAAFDEVSPGVWHLRGSPARTSHIAVSDTYTAQV